MHTPFPLSTTTIFWLTLSQPDTFLVINRQKPAIFVKDLLFSILHCILNNYSTVTSYTSKKKLAHPLSIAIKDSVLHHNITHIKTNFKNTF